MNVKTIQEKFDNYSNNVKKNIKSILLALAVLFVAVIYVCYQLLTLTPTDLNPITLIGQALVGIIAGVLIKTGLGEHGFIKGYSADAWVKALKRYNLKCVIALPFIDKANEYRELERIALECKPKMILAGASAYARKIDFKRIREICDKVGAYMMLKFRSGEMLLLMCKRGLRL